ncbi:hypothetical protein [Sphingomonas sp.]|uniref:hypothetical protein n=1 Tax=Sphingomonas sp. TaxID=28214 RepID=UPI001DE87C60|nr:hypothetical protein [Sphingomonas sp.]MBX9797730.1 hypothetical protein [Sphingomonas sp.]
MAMVAVLLFAGAVLVCGAVLVETLAPAWPRIAAILAGEAPRSQPMADVIPMPRRRPVRTAPRPVAVQGWRAAA